jgi:hypothetical protein
VPGYGGAAPGHELGRRNGELVPGRGGGGAARQLEAGRREELPRPLTLAGARLGQLI